MRSVSKETETRRQSIRNYIHDCFLNCNIRSMSTFRKWCYRYFDKLGTISKDFYYDKATGFVRAVIGSLGISSKRALVILKDILNIDKLDYDIEQLLLIGRGEDLRGNRYGRLVVVECVGGSDHGDVIWRCKCDCGNTHDVTSYSIKSGDSRSCGCYAKEVAKELIIKRSTTHGMSNSPTYETWRGMVGRCRCPNYTAWERYGGRGIKVCDRWDHSFENFYEDMGERPENTTLERIDNNGNYEPGNCKWADIIEQANNKSDTLKFDDGELFNLFVKEYNFEYNRAVRLFYKGYSKDEIIKALSTDEPV